MEFKVDSSRGLVKGLSNKIDKKRVIGFTTFQIWVWESEEKKLTELSSGNLNFTLRLRFGDRRSRESVVRQEREGVIRPL